ncbi:MAG TPA: hypothetical protein VK997_07560 [Deferrisomatales bacterium]|nr:hypothetical protein [Deferrisomatales bacterium]
MDKDRQKGRGSRGRQAPRREPEAAVAPGRVFPAVVAAVHGRWILPHCPRCVRPCCTLETLVLEFTWRQLRLLWGIRAPRREFDARLAEGRGPAEVRTQDGAYYVHKKVCPAYRDGLCAVYDSDLKPSGCSDFPLYVDDRGDLLADLRCEALSLDQVEAELRARLPPAASVRRRPHPEFPFLVAFRITPPGPAGRRGTPSARKRRP